jgi:L-serine dehydratase
MPERSSIFDMIGPIMIGPSSSHTGGVARIGRVARRLFGIQPQEVEITFYNSFARTYEGHGSDRAVLAGLLDMKPDDDRLRNALELATQAGMVYHMRAVLNASALHPNSIRVVMKGADRKMTVLGVSRGGGLISIVEIDGFSCYFSAQQPTLIITARDRPGSIAFISNIIAHDDCNIATMSVIRSGKNDMAKLVIELDSTIRDLTLDYLKSLSWVVSVIWLPDPET